MSCNPKDLTINHISSGANYLKKLNNNNSNSNSNNNNNNNNKKISMQSL
uniref:Uncharacterized protein n=1 Tax=viral metagenome TaxID=1070528 RepID=A0A6C0KSW0_9ZZZZ